MHLIYFNYTIINVVNVSASQSLLLLLHRDQTMMKSRKLDSSEMKVELSYIKVELISEPF